MEDDPFESLKIAFILSPCPRMARGSAVGSPAKPGGFVIYEADHVAELSRSTNAREVGWFLRGKQSSFLGYTVRNEINELICSLLKS